MLVAHQHGTAYLGQPQHLAVAVGKHQATFLAQIQYHNLVAAARVPQHLAGVLIQRRILMAAAGQFPTLAAPERYQASVVVAVGYLVSAAAAQRLTSVAAVRPRRLTEALPPRLPTPAAAAAHQTSTKC